MRRLLGIFVLMMISSPVFSGTIFESSSSGLADVRVLIVDSASKADLCVYVTKRADEARGKDEVWFYTDKQGLADGKICFVKNQGQADLKVFFVSSGSMAGWKTSSKYRGKFK